MSENVQRILRGNKLEIETLNGFFDLEFFLKSKLSRVLNSQFKLITKWNKEQATGLYYFSLPLQAKMWRYNNKYIAH